MSDEISECKFHCWSSTNPDKECPYCRHAAVRVTTLEAELAELKADTEIRVAECGYAASKIAIDRLIDARDLAIAENKRLREALELSANMVVNTRFAAPTAIAVDLEHRLYEIRQRAREALATREG